MTVNGLKKDSEWVKKGQWMGYKQSSEWWDEDSEWVKQYSEWVRWGQWMGYLKSELAKDIQGVKTERFYGECNWTFW